MVTVTINGGKKGREFVNMAHALAFVYQNGECYNAEEIEIACGGKVKPKEAKVKETAENAGNGSVTNGETEAAREIVENAGEGDIGNAAETE